MATQPSDSGDLGDSVSRAAHERVQRERDSAQSRVNELETVVRDLGLREKAIDYFRAKSIEDPVHWATVALPHLRDVEVDQVGARLDDLFGALPAGSSAPAPSEGPINQPTSAFEPRRPNPAAEGAQPRLEPIKPGSDEWKKVLKEEGLDGMRRLDKEGRIAWSAENLKAQGLRR